MGHEEQGRVVQVVVVVCCGDFRSWYRLVFADLKLTASEIVSEITSLVTEDIPENLADGVVEDRVYCTIDRVDDEGDGCEAEEGGPRLDEEFNLVRIPGIKVRHDEILNGSSRDVHQGVDGIARDDHGGKHLPGEAVEGEEGGGQLGEIITARGFSSGRLVRLLSLVQCVGADISDGNGVGQGNAEWREPYTECFAYLVGVTTVTDGSVPARSDGGREEKLERGRS